jgi:hypothetical protein
MGRRSYTYEVTQARGVSEWIEADHVSFQGGWVQFQREGRNGMVLVRAFSPSVAVEIQLVTDENGQAL